MENNQLSKDFVFELIKLCLIDDKSLSICQTYLKYQYLPLAPQKKIFKYILDGYAISGKAPTIGMIQQTYHTDLEVTNILSRVKKLVIEKDHYDEILVTFEVFIKDSRFRILYDRIGDLYNEGKMDDAIKLLADESKAINEFQIKSTLYTTVFSGFAQRNEKRQKEGDSILLEKLTYGIHGLDDPTRGGMNKGTSTLILARSGVGKSTFLRWIGLCNARLGRRVVHFQAEGTEAECLEAYDAGWTSIALHDIEFGNIPDGKKDKILKIRLFHEKNNKTGYLILPPMGKWRDMPYKWTENISDATLICNPSEDYFKLLYSSFPELKLINLKSVEIFTK